MRLSAHRRRQSANTRMKTVRIRLRHSPAHAVSQGRLRIPTGVVLVKCVSDNYHLIADNIGWFAESGEAKNIEEMMAERGEEVQRGIADGSFVIS